MVKSARRFVRLADEDDEDDDVIEPLHPSRRRPRPDMLPARTQPPDFIPPDRAHAAPDPSDEWDRPAPKPARHDPRFPRPRACAPSRIASALLAAAAVAAALLFFFRNALYTAALRQRGVPPGLWSRAGALYVGPDTPFFIKGLSWYGMEEPKHVFGGLDKVSVPFIFDFIQKYNFNAIRVPLAIDNILANKLPHTGLAAFKNPELVGHQYLDMLMSVIRTAADRNVLVMLDVHRLKNDDMLPKGLWFSDTVREDRLFLVWNILCAKFGREWNVLGADLFNEPWDALWDSPNKTADWKRASEQLGNTVHQSCPSWLLMIEGVGNRAAMTDTGVFWGENLHVMEQKPPQLTLSSKVALSPHVYGPAVYMQDYFKKDDFTADMPAIWDNHFGMANNRTGLATVVGEWGGTYVDKDKEWQQKFFDYLIRKKIGFFYWCLNPESGDTGGLLKADWMTPEHKKLALLDKAPSTSVGDHALHFKYWRNWRTQ